MQDKDIIPTDFQLMGSTYEVKYVENLIEAQNIYGLAEIQNNVVFLQESNEKNPLSIEFIESTFCHELVHCILGAMGEDKLYNNERFVESFGGLLHQFFKTANYNFYERKRIQGFVPSKREEAKDNSKCTK